LSASKFHSSWPPIVRSTQLSLFIRARDVILTLMAWALLIYFTRDLWTLIYGYLRDTLLSLDPSNEVDWMNIWRRIAPFIFAALLLVLWIVILGSLRRRAILSTGLIHGKNSLRTVQQQFPFKQTDIAILAQRFDVEASQLIAWQSMRSVDVEVNDLTESKSITEVNAG